MADVSIGQAFPPPPACPNGFLYTVQPGDSMFAIARRFGISLQALITANPQVADPNVIFPGQQLCVPVQFRPSQCRVLSVTAPFMTGDDVVAVQQALVARGFNPGAIDGIYGPMTAAAVRAFQASVGLAATGVVDAATYQALGIQCPAPPPPPPPPPPCLRGFIYTVRPGDTMFSIAQMFGVTLDALIAANPQVKDPNVIVPGQQLCVPTRLTPSQCRRLSLTTPFMQGDDVLAVQRSLVAHGFDPGTLDGIYGPRTEAAVRSFQQSAGLPVTGVVDRATYRALGIHCPRDPDPADSSG